MHAQNLALCELQEVYYNAVWAGPKCLGESHMESQRVKCPKCGTETIATENNCSHCGIDLVWATEHWSKIVTESQEQDSAVILLVDDDIGVLTMVEITLKRAGYRIAKAHNAVEALDLAPRLLPAVIATDVMMPGMDGIEFIRCLKANPAIQNIPVLVLSACDDSEAINRGMTAGASLYLTLPPPRDALIDGVKSLLNTSRLRDDKLPGQITLLPDQVEHVKAEIVAVA